MIPVEFGRAARDQLLAAGAEVLYEEYPLPHTLDPAFLADVQRWLSVEGLTRESGSAAPNQVRRR